MLRLLPRLFRHHLSWNSALPPSLFPVQCQWCQANFPGLPLTHNLSPPPFRDSSWALPHSSCILQGPQYTLSISNRCCPQGHSGMAMSGVFSTQCGVASKTSSNETVTWERMKPGPKASWSPCLAILYSATSPGPRMLQEVLCMTPAPRRHLLEKGPLSPKG